MTAYSNYTDHELLDAISHDDDRAFSELFKRYWRKVHGMAYARVRSKEATEEIVQELFTSLWDKRATQNIQHLSSYLYQAVKFKVLNYVESKGLEAKYWNYCKTFTQQKENSTQNTVDYNSLMEAIEEGMKQLPEKSKNVFRMNRFEGYSVSEIASQLNLSEKAIQYHLTQSIKKLRLHLKNFILSVALFIHLGG